MKIDLITKRDIKYPEACHVAKKIYEETIGVAPTSFPPTFISLFNEIEEVVGGVGLYHGNRIQEFLTESYCRHEGVGEEKYLNSDVSRFEIVEACCLNLKRKYRNIFLKSLFSATYEYLYAVRVRRMLLIAASTLNFTFQKLGTDRVFLCHPNLEKYDGSADERKKWAKVYFDKLKPECCYIEVSEARIAYKNKLQENPNLLASVDLGPKLSSVLNEKQAISL